MTIDTRSPVIASAASWDLCQANPDSTPDLPGALVDAGGTRLRLRALHVMGHGPARVARAIGAAEQSLAVVTSGQARTVRPQLRDAVIEVYEAWWDKRAPEGTSREQLAARAARRQAFECNWCAPAALDDDQMDTSGYQPSHGYLPARGSGVAGDSVPAAHPGQHQLSMRSGNDGKQPA
jgi:hypothetical protein